MNSPAVAHPVIIRTHTEAHPTSTSLPLSPTEVDHPVRSIAEYMLAREKMIWKNAYEYVTGLLAFSFSSCSSALSNGSKGFPPSPGKTRCQISRWNSVILILVYWRFHHFPLEALLWYVSQSSSVLWTEFWRYSGCLIFSAQVKNIAEWQIFLSMQNSLDRIDTNLHEVN